MWNSTQNNDMRAGRIRVRVKYFIRNYFTSCISRNTRRSGERNFIHVQYSIDLVGTRKSTHQHTRTHESKSTNSYILDYNINTVILELSRYATCQLKKAFCY